MTPSLFRPMFLTVNSEPTNLSPVGWLVGWLIHSLRPCQHDKARGRILTHLFIAAFNSSSFNFNRIYLFIDIYFMCEPHLDSNFIVNRGIEIRNAM